MDRVLETEEACQVDKMQMVHEIQIFFLSNQIFSLDVLVSCFRDVHYKKLDETSV